MLTIAKIIGYRVVSSQMNYNNALLYGIVGQCPQQAAGGTELIGCGYV